MKRATSVVTVKSAVAERVSTQSRAMHVLNDDACVERAKGGDLGAFRVLVERYEQRLYPLAFSLTTNHADAQDVLQDAFLKAFRNLGAFREQSSFYTWLYRIVCNVAIDRSRKRKRRGEAQIVYGEDGGLGCIDIRRESDTYLSKVARPDEAFTNLELREGIRSAVASLSPEHRAVIMLREIDGLSYEEMSDSLGVSKGTVMSRLHHARKRLQGMLAEFFVPTAALSASPRQDLFDERLSESRVGGTLGERLKKKVSAV